MRRSNLFIIPVLFGYISFAQAIEGLKDCEPLYSDHPEKAKKYVQCLDLNIELLKTTEQTWFQKLLLDIQKIQEDTGNTQLLPIIQRSARNQSNYLDDTCRWRYLHKMPNPTKAAIAFKRCEITLRKQNIETLMMPY
ncbi:putative orphan protein [Pseudoalteromonas luteoviolacea B = ATCC 29581]|nr:putative orphan protein [Pseudoalteromonas luteoviolacea B = ATCC 29581]